VGDGTNRVAAAIPNPQETGALNHGGAEGRGELTQNA